MTAPVASDDAVLAAKTAARAQWERDRAVLLVEQPFIAMLAMNMDIVAVADDRLPTAATDGQRLLVNPWFLQSLTADERMFVLAHEVWHCALGHFVRQGTRDRHLWNVAIDHEVNAMLRSEGMAMPDCAVYFPEWDGQNAETVYALLQRTKRTATRGRLADVHDGADEPSDASAGGVGRTDPDLGSLQPDPAVARQWPTRVVAVAQQLERHRGTLSQGLRHLVQQLVQPQVPWREVLRQFVTRSFGGTRRWLPPARRYIHRQLYLPSRHCDAVDLALAIDSSGSTYGQCHQFIAELGALASSFGRCSLDVLVCNDRLQRRFYLEEDGLQRLAGLHWPWGGGTDFRPVFAQLAQEPPPTALLYLTDGEGEAPLAPPPYPVLWVLTRNGKAPAPWGEVVRMDE